MSALDSWSHWSCGVNGCTAHGECCDDDAAERDLRVHVLTRHYPPGTGDPSGLVRLLASERLHA